MLHCRDQESSVLEEEMESVLPHLHLLGPKLWDFLTDAAFLIMIYKLSNFILVSVKERPKICLDWRTCCQMRQIIALAAAFIQNTSF